MTIHRESFDALSTGLGVPAGFTSRWVATGTWRVLDEAGDKFVRRDAGDSSDRRLLSHDAATAEADADAEILVKVRVYHASGGLSSTSIAGVALRCSGAAGSETGYLVNLYSSNLRLSKLVSGTSTAITTTSSTGLAKNTWYWLRVKLTGTTIQARIWPDSGSEPGTWALNTTDASITAAGWSGLYSNDGSINCDWGDCLVGTGGESPEVPSATPPATAPTIGTITPTGNGASIAFSAFPAGATGLEYRIDGGAWTAAAGTASPLVVTGLYGETEYDIELRATNGAGAGPASTLATFTTLGEGGGDPVRGVQLALYSGSTPRASVTGITALWWDSEAPSGAPAVETTAATDAGGVLELDIEAETALDIGDSGFLLLYKLDGADHRDSLTFAGRLAVVDIG